MNHTTDILARNTTTIDELVVAAKSGDRDSFDVLAERLRPRLHNFLRGKTARAEDAEDLVQESLLRAYTHLDRYDCQWQFTTWLFTIAARLAVSHHRASKPTSALTEVAEAAPQLDHVVMARRAGTRLWGRARELLGEREYRVVYLRYAEDLSPKEIAAKLGMSAVHVRVTLYRARRQLAEEVN